jgi:hypothetical protein
VQLETHGIQRTGIDGRRSRYCGLDRTLRLDRSGRQLGGQQRFVGEQLTILAGVLLGTGGELGLGTGDARLGRTGAGVT